MIKLTKLYVIFALLLFVSHSTHSQQSGKINTDHIKKKWLDLEYATISPAQKLDIYLPDEKGKGPYPIIISIHGGAFMFGDKADSQLKPMLEGLKHGYAVVSINYRMSGEALFPKNINDVKAAIRWIKANANQYNLNANKVALWGGSAGGNLSALAGTSGDVKELEDMSLGNADQSSRVEAVVNWFGPTDFLAMDDQLRETGNGTPDHSEANSPESKVLGQKITEIPEKVKEANPETYITSDDPPFFIQHGTKDHLVPTQQSINFAKKLEAVLGKEKVTLVLLEGSKHGGPAFETPENIKLVFVFLDAYLK
ncbi:alpha/beta hydrolase [Aquiflexum sp. TKW24L]|uniref:alpha/beta hydrolase n=1 Tax=Aquiflexum sp. TKW24L TaxID=2942212 RepID=UPI0020BE3DDD|nr:alpha/beta hydrolase [Aquiflexum sp. TKW24L]MCL6258086.1 alpha/beta hydrolase [Aquiflexum sp. TKW24L]